LRGSRSCFRRKTVKKKQRSEEARIARERAFANAESLRRLAEKAQAELDRRKQQGASP